MDFTLLKLLEKMRKKKISLKNNVIASSIGSLGACFIYLIEYEIPQSISLLAVWILCYIMIVLVYGKQNPWWYIYESLLLFILSFIAGGMINYLYYEIGLKGFLKRKGLLVTLIAFLVFSLFLYTTTGKIIQIIRKQEKMIAYKTVVVIERKGKKVELEGYIDTGNRLYEPISHKPVILVEYDCVKSLFSTEEKKFLETYLENQNETQENICVNSVSVRVVPYQCAAGNTGFFISVPYDWIFIENKKIKKGYMALQKEKLSENGEYEVLLHTELIG